ncbi:MAG: porin [Gammaproteobacteria bacterium]|nr:porin [Gammaproteobacteria bacterium]
MKLKLFSAAAAGCLLACSQLVLADGQPPTPTIEQLWEIIQSQQAEIEALKKEQQETAKQAADADEKAEAAVVAVEEVDTKTAGVASWVDKTTIGGYGELHYNNFEGEDNELDLHRFVLFFGHEFTDSIRFFSEFEIEHDVAGDGKNGEVEVEQAYVEFDLRENMQAKGGVFLMPVGILNETHEPGTFYGVERNDVENIIIPSTWWEGGAALNGYFENGISWDLAITSGLEMPTTGNNAFRVRSGRQKASEATANDLSYTGRLKYTGTPGLELAATVNYQSNATQSNNDGLNEGILYETHAIYNKGPFGLRALYARWNFNGSAVSTAGADDQYGWYIEPSYKPWEKVGLYTRYEKLDGARDQDQFDQWEVGANFWPHPDVVLKADYRDRNVDSNSSGADDVKAFDLGIGYQF